MGQSPKSETYNQNEEGIPFFQGNADFGEINPVKKYYCTEPAKIAKANDLLVSVRAPIGAINIANCECCIGRGLAGITAKDKIIFYLYLYYFLKSKVDDLKNKGTGSTFKAINKNILYDLPVPLPPIETQKQIAHNLDAITNIISLRKKQLLELDNLIKSVFYDMFGDPAKNEKEWKVIHLSKLTYDSLMYGSGASATKFDNNIRYIRITDINYNGTLNEEKVSPNIIENKYLLKEGDILFARSGATVGKTFKFNESFGKCIFAGYLIKFTPNVDIILPDYIFYFTKTEFYRKFIESNIKLVAQPNINAKQYGNLKIPVPPIHLQNQFAIIVEKIEEQKSIIKKGLSESQNLFDSLMSQYFI
ncbi:MAG: restriction endonuclease subunit S [Oscillospiraceae bacterium]|nr:restriction endonuclease subunit S [Oscillospiraceae bacterium]